MIICHDVVRDRQKEQYQGSSPDEVCFIEFAHSIGYTFVKRTKNSIELKIHR
jgi:magnesium-transporting ATPase (P-type)